MRELIADDEKCKGEEKLEGLLLEGLQGDAKVFTADDWQSIRKEAAARHSRRGSSEPLTCIHIMDMLWVPV